MENEVILYKVDPSRKIWFSNLKLIQDHPNVSQLRGWIHEDHNSDEILFMILDYVPTITLNTLVEEYYMDGKPLEA